MTASLIWSSIFNIFLASLSGVSHFIYFLNLFLKLCHLLIYQTDKVFNFMFCQFR